MEGESYKVRLDIFEGPLDLLLYLIKKDEVDIQNISIARITGQYLDYIETFRLLNIDLAAEFIVMAANLMYLKSRTLLPKQEQPPDEEAEEDEEDAEDEEDGDEDEEASEKKEKKEKKQMVGKRLRTGAQTTPRRVAPKNFWV